MAASGWGRSEATICMLLQRRGTARRVYASVVHVAVKKFGAGHETPLLQLNPRSYVSLLNEFYAEVKERAGLTADDVDYLEAEGGGYKVKHSPPKIGLWGETSTSFALRKKKYLEVKVFNFEGIY